MLRVAIANEPDRDRRERLERARLELLDERLNPLYLEAAASTARPSGASARRTTTSSTGLRLSPRRARRPVRCAARRDRGALGARPATASSGSGSGSGSATRALPTSRASSARPSSTPPTRAERMLPALEATLADLGIDLRSPGERPPRHRAATRQEPACLLRADRGSRQGDARDPADRRARRLVGALPRGGSHRALRAHLRATCPMEAKRLGDMAVTEGWAMLLQHLVDEPAWLDRRLDVPRVGADRERRRRLAALLRAPLLREAPLRDRVLPGRRPGLDARRATRSSSPTRSPFRPTPRATSTTSTAPSTSPATCARGRSRRSCASSCAANSETTGSRGAAAGDLLRELWSARPGAECRRAPRRGERSDARAGRCRRAHPRRARGVRTTRGGNRRPAFDRTDVAC